MKGKKVILTVEEKLEVLEENQLRKKFQDRLIICACANVTCTIKLPLLFIGKSASYRPHFFVLYIMS